MKLVAGLARLLGVGRAMIVFGLVASPFAMSRVAAQTAEDLPGALEALQDRTPVQPAKTFGDPMWRKRWWIEKTARLLRGGEGLGPDDDVEALLRLPEEDIARRFMADPRFGDTVLDFNMYFLGFRIDSLKSGGVYKRNAFDFANAVASAQALLQGGDYLKLFDLEGPFYLWPLPLEFDDPLPANETHLAPQSVRIKAIDEVEAVFTRLIALGSKSPAADDYCHEFEKVLGRFSSLSTSVLRVFNDPEVFVLRRGQVLIRPIEIVARAYQAECVDKPESQTDVKRLDAAVREAFEYFYRAIGEILKFEPSNYQPRTVLEFRTFDLAVFGMDKWLAFGFEQSNSLQMTRRNSSTSVALSGCVTMHLFLFRRLDDITEIFPEPLTSSDG